MFKMHKPIKKHKEKDQNWKFPIFCSLFLSMQLYNYYNLENLGRYMHLLIHIVKNFSPPRSLEPEKNKGVLSRSLGDTCKEFF